MKITLNEVQEKIIYDLLDSEAGNTEFCLDLEGFLKSCDTKEERNRMIEEYIEFHKLCNKFKICSKEQLEEEIKFAKSLKEEI